MYFEGRPLGSDLTDNAYDDDGYRFHDVLHLALIAHLGWSPVIRGLMKRKRKGNKDKIDEVEDGGRAQVVEELVLKAIHSEGERLARELERCTVDGTDRLFPVRSLISFRLLKTLRMYVEGLEVGKNAYWEWENAIFEGCEMFGKLRAEKQGTIHVDLLRRKLTFLPTVSPEIRGVTVGLGMAVASTATSEEGTKRLLLPDELARTSCAEQIGAVIAAKRAVLEALGLPKTKLELYAQCAISFLGESRISVKADGIVQERAWALHVVDYKAAFTTSADQVFCTVTAIADVVDANK